MRSYSFAYKSGQTSKWDGNKRESSDSVFSGVVCLSISTPVAAQQISLPSFHLEVAVFLQH